VGGIGHHGAAQDLTDRASWASKSGKDGASLNSGGRSWRILSARSSRRSGSPSRLSALVSLDKAAPIGNQILPRYQVSAGQGLIAGSGGRAFGRLLAIRWQDGTSECGMCGRDQQRTALSADCWCSSADPAGTARELGRQTAALALAGMVSCPPGCHRHTDADATPSHRRHRLGRARAPGKGGCDAGHRGYQASAQGPGVLR
jgi:hypothetical protein